MQHSTDERHNITYYSYETLYTTMHFGLRLSPFVLMIWGLIFQSNVDILVFHVRSVPDEIVGKSTRTIPSIISLNLTKCVDIYFGRLHYE